jgi:hypothetical protein
LISVAAAFGLMVTELEPALIEVLVLTASIKKVSAAIEMLPEPVVRTSALVPPEF